jgi:hypothetical protein
MLQTFVKTRFRRKPKGETSKTRVVEVIRAEYDGDVRALPMGAAEFFFS